MTNGKEGLYLCALGELIHGAARLLGQDEAEAAHTVNSTLDSISIADINAAWSKTKNVIEVCSDHLAVEFCRWLGQILESTGEIWSTQGENRGLCYTCMLADCPERGEGCE